MLIFQIEDVYKVDVNFAVTVFGYSSLIKQCKCSASTLNILGEFHIFSIVRVGWYSTT